MQPFLDKIAERLLNKFPDNMERVLVVLPSKRSVVFLKSYLSKRIKAPIFLPQFYSIEEFVERLSGLQVLDNVSLQFKLYESYLNTNSDKVENFDKFLSWGGTVLHDFNDIDRSLVDAKAIYTNLTNVKELESWSIDDWSLSQENLSHLQQDYISFFKSMFVLYSDFKEKLLREKLAYQGLAYRSAAVNIKDVTLEWEKIWFVGLNALTKSEQEIINYLKEKDVARVFWDADNFYYNNPIHEAGSFLRIQRDKWKEIDFQGVGNYFSQRKDNFQIIGCPKKISQAKVVAELVKKLTKEDLEDSNTAIVLAEESLLFPVLHHLPSSVKRLNVTMGSPVKNTALFAFIEVVFNMHIRASQYNQESFYYKDVIDLIEQPYFIKLSDSDSAYKLKNYIVENNVIFINYAQIKEIFFNQELGGLFFNLWATSYDVISFLEQLITLLRKPLVGKKGTIESEVLTVINRNILILKRLINHVDFDINLVTFQRIMTQLISKEVIPFQGEPLQGVQLMGLLESRTLDFKNIIVLSVNEGVLPKGKVFSSFIPYDMRRYFELPTYLERDSLFAYHFYRLLQRAQNISLVYNTETDDFGNGEKSRFITQLLSEYRDTNLEHLLYRDKELDLAKQEQLVIKNEGLRDEIIRWAGEGVSPSAINKYNHCQIAFYYHYLAKVRVSKEVDEYADDSTIGTAIHNALEAHYPLGILTEKFIKNNKELIIDSLNDNFKKLISEEYIKQGKNYLNLEIAKKLMNNFLNLEVKLLQDARQENKQIKILAKEEELTCILNLDGIDFQLIGKVDRIDLLGDELRIIDYKTGKVDPSELIFNDYKELDSEKKAKLFQLLMYAYIYIKSSSHKMNGKVFAANISFKNIKKELIKVSEGGGRKKTDPLCINNSVLTNFEEHVKRVLTRILKNDFKSTNNLKSCQFCEYKSICKQ